MKKFQFRLDRVMEYKKKVEEEKKKELFTARENLRLAIENLKKLMKERKDIMDTLKNFQRDDIKINHVLLYLNYLYALNEKIKLKKIEVSQKEREVAEKEKELIEARKEVKVLENLREKRYQDYLQEVKRKEQFMEDEFAKFTYLRREYGG